MRDRRETVIRRENVLLLVVFWGTLFPAIFWVGIWGSAVLCWFSVLREKLLRWGIGGGVA